ncbi:TonB family protein [Teredinibacter sp. KSP-S5-2]|uniref:TonB family protein n=1 Tax=Teredinibacter sp. KSP-S5-2 TaxID=3034506 RepID=UPI00293486D3|nr:TonB family protein [Teredinibacter sp. KSP-S5-2]WNO10148.1 TonB family protein [Teredinibacter sp. KSP-S5-2]
MIRTKKTPISQIGRLITIAALSIASLCASAEPTINGMSTHSELGKEQFIAALFTETLTDSSRDVLLADENKRIQVRVTADRLSSRRFKRMWIEGMAINASPAELEKQAQNMADFSNMLKIKMLQGDIFTIDRGSDTVKVILNGVQLGEIESTQFFDLLLRAWIGPVPLSSEFRSKLVANGKVESGLQSRFDETRPSDERIATVDELAQSIAARHQEASEDQTDIPKVAVDLPSEPTVAAPKIATAPLPTAKVDIAPPAAVAATKPTPEPPKAKPQPKAKPKPKLAMAPKEELLDDELEEDDLDFTAESLLEQQLYIAKLKKWSSKFMKYPSRALSLSQEGIVRLAVTIDREGKVLNIESVQNSDYSALDKAAEKGVKRASPFPAMPEKMSGEQFTFSLPVVFQLK